MRIDIRHERAAATLEFDKIVLDRTVVPPEDYILSVLRNTLRAVLDVAAAHREAELHPLHAMADDGCPHHD